MTEAEDKQLEVIRNRVARFNFGKTMQIAADMKFLLERIDALKAELGKEKAK